MRIGILGGGQLAMMMVETTQHLDLEYIVVDPAENPPASKFTNCIRAEFDDKKMLDMLIKECDVVTIDFENVPAESLEYLETKIQVFPSSQSLRICQDRKMEKELFIKNNVKAAEYQNVSSLEDLKNAVKNIGKDSILKSRKFGYDGKNQFMIQNNDIEKIWIDCKKIPSILEKKINFKTELSLIGVRDQKKEIVFYPLVENIHKKGILRISVSDYGNNDLQNQAEKILKKIMESLDYIGVLVIEFFLTSDDVLIANEMAPRVHNSGHWSIEGANISQFESHINSIIGVKNTQIKIIKKSAMINLLGTLPKFDKIYKLDNVFIHKYNKKERANRKLGHITIIDDNDQNLKKKINSIENIIN
ncbi:MAG: 5-(carboxyamino)imidazole ribonucleotide synthase [Gammaproteobacteria bacterium]|nr:5-(carboxyamino)imidazole ribonucleotide synthase [Gammaproteobacteria bacterium]|tara:strand:+ start:28593 stop:29675 length:1083 start_codon:yes stop_codon:yes gene_type:complete